MQQQYFFIGRILSSSLNGGAEIGAVDNGGNINSEFSCNNTANYVKKAKCN